MPPREVLEIFGRVCLSARRRLFSPESRSLAAMRDALLPKLISGELRLKDAKKFIGKADL